MKRLCTWILTVCLMLPLFACGASEDTEKIDLWDHPEAKGTFCVGFGRVAITPYWTVPLGGYGNSSERLSIGSYDYIYANCVAITDEKENTVLLFSLDQGNVQETMSTPARERIAAATGVPEDHIMINASHSHSVPDLNSNDYGITRFKAQWPQWLTEAAVAAMQDRMSATMSIGSVETEGLNFVRRYILENGTYAGDNYGNFASSPIASHETEADPTLQLLRFERQGGKDVVMANFQAHGTIGSNTHRNEQVFYELSPDWIGAFRRCMEAEYDCLCTYVQGAAGNINPYSRIESENRTDDQREYGNLLTSYVRQIWDHMTPAATGAVRTSQSICEGTVDHSNDYLLPQAREIWAYWSSTYDTQKCKEMGEPYGINSPYAANSIMLKAGLGQTLEVELDAISIGEVAFAVAPYEMFDTNAMAIRASSPFVMTFIMAYSNQYLGYMPDSEAYSHGGYERDQCRFVQGSAELFADELVKLLNGLYTE